MLAYPNTLINRSPDTAVTDIPSSESLC